MPIDLNTMSRQQKEMLAAALAEKQRRSWSAYNPSNNPFGDMQEGEGIPASRQIGQGVDAFASGIASGATMGVLGQPQEPNSRLGRAEQAHPIINAVGDMAGSIAPITSFSAGVRMITGEGIAGGGISYHMSHME